MAMMMVNEADRERDADMTHRERVCYDDDDADEEAINLKSGLRDRSSSIRLRDLLLSISQQL